MAYLLQDLVRVRELREDRASKALTVARRRTREAEQALEDRRRELAEYREWRLQEEERLVQSIMLKKVKLGEITDLRLEIIGLRERELEFTDRVHRAEADLTKAREEEEAARQAHKKATQELEKLLGHREEWEQEQSREAERAADLELEEFTMPAPGHHADGLATVPD